MDTTLLASAVLLFLFVVLSIEGFYNVWSVKHSKEAKRIKARLSALDEQLATEIALERDEKATRLAWVQGLLERSAKGKDLSNWVGAAGLPLTAGMLVGISVALALVGWVLPGMLGKGRLGLLAALVLGTLPWLYISRKRKARIKQFEGQFPEALDLMGRAMRAGHAFPTAVKMVAEEIPAPLGKDFRILFDEMNYGVPVGEALTRLAERVPLADISFFVVAVMIQRESGGNMAELLDKISAIVRGRLKLLGDVQTLSAEGRMSGRVLLGLPFAVMAAINIVNPNYLTPLFEDPFGQTLVLTAVTMMFIGWLWMRKIVAIRV